MCMYMCVCGYVCVGFVDVFNGERLSSYVASVKNKNENACMMKEY